MEQVSREITYDSYCKQVCSVLKKATQKEKTALSEELLDHMESHAEALIELGWDPEEARTYAIQAMGDAETVGRQYDEKLSSFWLWCGCVARIVLILLMGWILTFPVWGKGINVYYNLEARLEAARYTISAQREENPSMWRPLDVEIPLEHDVLRFYCGELIYNEDRELYSVGIRGVSYAKNPFRLAGPWLGYVEIEGFRSTGGGSSGACQSRNWWGQVQMGQEYVVLTIKRESTGTDIRVEVPLPWEGLP